MTGTKGAKEEGRELEPWERDLVASLPVLLTRKRAARALQCSERVLDRRIREGRIKPRRNGRTVLIPRAELLAFLNGRP